MNIKNLGLDIQDADQKQDKIAEMKEKMYDSYDPNSSKRGVQKTAEFYAVPEAPVPPAIGESKNKPKFSLNMNKIPGVTPQASTGLPNLTGGDGITPSNHLMNKKNFRNVAELADNVSEMSQSPVNAGAQISARFRARMGAGGIPTPLGSDMSRAKFDFSGYDP